MSQSSLRRDARRSHDVDLETSSTHDSGSTTDAPVVQRKAISAAPSLVQRLWNPFSKKSTASSTKGLTRDEVDGNAQFAEHYASWQERRGVYGDTMYVFEHRVRKPFQRELDRAAEHAEAALATITRSTRTSMS